MRTCAIIHPLHLELETALCDLTIEFNRLLVKARIITRNIRFVG